MQQASYGDITRTCTVPQVAKQRNPGKQKHQDKDCQRTTRRICSLGQGRRCAISLASTTVTLLATAKKQNGKAKVSRSYARARWLHIPYRLLACKRNRAAER